MSDVQDELRIARRLEDAVRLARNCGDPALMQGYDRVINTVDELQQYFSRIAEILESAVTDATVVSGEIKTLLMDRTDEIKSQNDKIMV